MNHEQYTKPIDEPKDIPADLGDEEQMEYLMAHGVSEEFLEKAEEAPEDERPHPRTRPINVRFDDFTLGRLKDMANRRNVGYQTLLKDFVVERLYQEEVREGVLLARLPDRPTTEVGEARQEPEEVAKPRQAVKPRDWQSWAYSFAKENEVLLEDPDVDSITLSRLAKDASERLLELSGEIGRVSTKKGFPATQLRRMVKGYERLKALTERAIELYEENFGSEDYEEGQADDMETAARQVVEEAERIVRGAL